MTHAGRTGAEVLMFILTLGLSVAGGWNSFGHDSRRSSQSEAVGPASIEQRLTAELAEGQSINLQAVITEDGVVLTGTWGMVRSNESNDVADWDKFDGALFAFDEALSPTWRYQPDPTPWCYTYDGREEAQQCPEGGEWNGYNGTVEGSPVVADGRIVFGRGDGKVYAVSPEGEALWSFATFNGEDEADPEGGGEVVGGPLATPDGAIVFGTIAAGPYETNAVYAVEGTTGALRWRFPDGERGLDEIVWAPPALSPDGQTVYVATAWGPEVNFNAESHGHVWAIDVVTGAVKWSYEPIQEELWWKPWVWLQRLAVGADGTIYAAGSMYTLDAGHAVVLALHDDGDAASEVWAAWPEVDGDAGQWALGLALDEVNGVTERVIAGSSAAPILGSYPDGGGVVALDAATGSTLWTFLPRDEGWAGGVLGVATDANGNVYATASGKSDAGRLFALDDAGAVIWSEPLGGLAEWGSPAIGPDGTVYVGDTRQCALRSFPVEQGYCDDVNITPTLYAFRGTALPLDTGRDDTTAPAGCEGCSSGAAGATWVWGIVGLAVGLRRSRR